MIISSRYGVSRAEFFLDEPLKKTNADIVRLSQWSSLVDGFHCTPFHTRVIDLSEPLDRLLKNLDSDNRRIIRRAEERDGLVYRAFPGSDRAALEKICTLHHEFTTLKNLEPIDQAHLYRLSEAGQLELGMVEDQEGNILAWRTCYRDGNRVVRCIHAGSLFRATSITSERQLIGRANRFGWWQDIARCHEAKVAIFDMGGWYAGNEDVEKLRINKFKKEFGGTVVLQYHGVRAQTWKGKAALKLAELRDRRAALAQQRKSRLSTEVAESV